MRIVGFLTFAWDVEVQCFGSLLRKRRARIQWLDHDRSLGFMGVVWRSMKGVLTLEMFRLFNLQTTNTQKKVWFERHVFPVTFREKFRFFGTHPKRIQHNIHVDFAHVFLSDVGGFFNLFSFELKMVCVSHMYFARALFGIGSCKGLPLRVKITT